jgi:hypothetical protein
MNILVTGKAGYPWKKSWNTMRDGSCEPGYHGYCSIVSTISVAIEKEIQRLSPAPEVHPLVVGISLRRLERTVRLS